MAKESKTKKKQKLTEIRAMVDPELAACFHNEANQMRRKFGSHLEAIFEERYNQPTTEKE